MLTTSGGTEEEMMPMPRAMAATTSSAMETKIMRSLLGA